MTSGAKLVVTLYEKGERMSKEYLDFLKKFDEPKTTDDCFTPPEIYEFVKDWAVKRYDLEGREIVRPFYPGGDYETFEYNRGVVVIDNPPFSLQTKIIDFYLEKGIDFFLFANGLTTFSAKRDRPVCAVIVNGVIEYENGAKVSTSFLTNLDSNSVIANAELNNGIQNIMRRISKAKKLPKYKYPKNVVMVNDLKKAVTRGYDVEIPFASSQFVTRLDDQKEHNKKMFGDGLLVSNRVAELMDEAKNAPIKEQAQEWGLSEGELKIIRGLV